MKLLVCARFFIFFGLFASFETINGFGIDDYLKAFNEFDDYFYDDSAEPINDEITLHTWNLEISEPVDDSNSEGTKVHPLSLVKRNNYWFVEALEDVLDFFKASLFFGPSSHNKEEIDPEANNTSSENTTTSENFPSTMTPAPHVAAKNISSTVVPKIVTTTAESKDTTTETSSSTVTPAPDKAAKDVSLPETPEIVETTAESVNNVKTAVSVDKNMSTQANKL